MAVNKSAKEFDMADYHAKVWLEEEADAYFGRNKKGFYPHDDLVIKLIKLYDLCPQKVLEIGAANGWRLARLVEIFGCEAVAVEPSAKAIEDGKQRFPSVKFFRALGEDISFTSEFDLIIVNFVFHWVSRSNLFKFMQKYGYLVASEKN
jgi:trans-aconitate methyltransferase